ncbi:D-alanyl-D-alanine carboxypeptidase family protein [Actinotalea sp.]|uniref:M15 family metallopeptidase n=1 Tax=Actinotalea sp. TaxID=1872145 RepID=UPI003568A963
MDAISSIQSRIAEIQTRIASLESATPAVAVLGGTSSTTASSGFASVLASEQARSVGSATAVGSGRSALNAKGVPLAYVAYGNGKVPSTELSTISGTSAQLWPNAARSFEAMRSAAAADGVTIGVTDSYRSYEAQVDVAARKGIYGQGGLAAVPGTSDHGWGMALDLRLDDAAQSWMQANAQTYGYVDDTPGESWHWHYVPTS